MSCKLGDSAQVSRTISESDIYLFAGLTGDHNPLHTDEEYAKATRFGGRIAHGMLIASHLCTVLGMKLPGPGTIHVEQSVRFCGPVRIGDTVTARAEVIDIFQEGLRQRVRLRTTVTNQKGEVVITGEALVVPPRIDS